MPVYGGKIFRFHHHVQRLLAGLERLRIETPFSAEGLWGIFQKLCERNITHGVARVYVTRGPGVALLSTTSVAQPTVVAIAWSHATPHPETLRAVISSIRVDNESSLTRIKSANRLMYVLAKQEADRLGVDEALLLNQNGHVVEFSAYKVFAVSDGRLVTPPVSEGALPGIAREEVMQIAEKLEIPAFEMSMKPADLADADEIFATNSVREIVAVEGLNGNPPIEKHRITRQLRQAYRDLVREELGL